MAVLKRASVDIADEDIKSFEPVLEQFVSVMNNRGYEAGYRLLLTIAELLYDCEHGGGRVH